MKKQIIYITDCIENGERFFSKFKTIETDKTKLLEYGINIASGWGGECISVKKNKDQRDVELVYDYDKEIA